MMDKANAKNFIQGFNADIRTEVLAPVNKANYLINKYRTSMSGTGGPNPPRDQVQEVGDELFAVLNGAFNRDTFDAITEADRKAVESAFQDLLEMGYEPPQVEQ